MTGLLAWPAAHADTLGQVITGSLATNPDVLTRLHERQIRNELLEEGRAGLRPQVNFVSEIGREWSRNSGTQAARRAAGKADDNTYVRLWRRQATIDARQLIYDGNGTPSEIERRLASADASAYQLQDAVETVLGDISDAYLKVQRDRRLLELSRRNLEDHERIHDQIRERSQAGIGRKADLDQADGRLALAEANLVSSEAKLEDTVASYVRVVGDEPPEELQAVSSHREQLPKTVDEAVGIALREHPAVIAAEADLAAAAELIRVAESRMQPRLELQLSGRYGDDLNGVEGFDQDWMALVNMEYNLYNGGADQARVRRTRSLLRQAQDRRESALREVEETVRLGWNDFTSIERRLEVLRRQVDATVRARDAYRQQFNLGERSLLDLLDSENELFEARRSLAEAENEFIIAVYRVYSGMARLTRMLEVPLPSEALPFVERPRTN